MKMKLLQASLIFLSLSLSAQPVLKIKTDTIYRAPESVAFDSIRNVIYVSNYTAPVREGSYYGKHTVSKADLEGNLIEADWITGLTSPTGICIHKDKLYIVERFGVVEYDLAADTICNKYYIKTTDFLNDLALDDEDNIYVTLSGTKIIYRISHGIVEKWLEDDLIANPNGILYDRGRLVVGSTDHSSLNFIDPVTREISPVAAFGEGVVDGIKACNDGYLVTVFGGQLFHVSESGELDELINTKNKKLFLADFEYIPSKELIIVPALWNNRLLIYTYSEDK